jgi:hypothetical protein
MSDFGAFLPFPDVRAMSATERKAGVRRTVVKPTSVSQVR